MQDSKSTQTVRTAAPLPLSPVNVFSEECGKTGRMLMMTVFFVCIQGTCSEALVGLLQHGVRNIVSPGLLGEHIRQAVAWTYLAVLREVELALTPPLLRYRIRSRPS